MAIGEKILESVELTAEHARDANHLQSLRETLLEKHWLMVATYQQEPQFYLQAASGTVTPRNKN